MFIIIMLIEANVKYIYERMGSHILSLVGTTSETTSWRRKLDPTRWYQTTEPLSFSSELRTFRHIERTTHFWFNTF